MNEDWKNRLIGAISDLVQAAYAWGDSGDSNVSEAERSTFDREREVEAIIDEGVGGFEAMKRILQADVDLLNLSLSECRQRRRELQEEIEEIREDERDKHLDFKFHND